MNTNQRALSPQKSHALVPVRVDGWTLYQNGGGEWIHDLDLAAKANLSRSRDIRPVIKRALADGLVFEAGNIAIPARDVPHLENQGSAEAPSPKGRKSKAANIARGAGDVPLPRPLVRVELTSKLLGNGARRIVEEFFLSRDAAVVILFQLRTAEAKRLQGTLLPALLRVFDLAQHARVAEPLALTHEDVRAIVREELRAEVLLQGREQLALRAHVDAFLASARAALLAIEQHVQNQEESFQELTKALEEDLSAHKKSVIAALTEKVFGGLTVDVVRNIALDVVREQTGMTGLQILRVPASEEGARPVPPEGVRRAFYDAVKAAAPPRRQSIVHIAGVLATRCDDEGITTIDDRHVGLLSGVGSETVYAGLTWLRQEGWVETAYRGGNTRILRVVLEKA